MTKFSKIKELRFWQFAQKVLTGIVFCGNREPELSVMDCVYAFQDCSNLVNITLPTSIEHIDVNVFASRENLEKIDILAKREDVYFANDDLLFWDKINWING